MLQELRKLPPPCHRATLDFAHAPPDEENAIESIARYVDRRCFGRIFRLAVELRDDHCVVIYGRTGTYYAKQLAQHAVQEVVKGSNVENRIEVVAGC